MPSYDPGMATGEVFPIINSGDLGTAREYYSLVFSAVQTYQSPESGDPEFVTLAIGSGTIAIGIGTGPAMYGERPLPASGHAIDLCLYVAHLDAVVERARSIGGPVVVEPTTTPWGERVAYLRDPDGTMLLVIQQG